MLKKKATADKKKAVKAAKPAKDKAKAVAVSEQAKAKPIVVEKPKKAAVPEPIVAQPSIPVEHEIPEGSVKKHGVVFTYLPEGK